MWKTAGESDGRLPGKRKCNATERIWQRSRIAYLYGPCHTAAAAAHNRGDHEAAEELSAEAHAYSISDSEESSEIAKQSQVHLRALECFQSLFDDHRRHADGCSKHFIEFAFKLPHLSPSAAQDL